MHLFDFVYGTVTPCGWPFQTYSTIKTMLDLCPQPRVLRLGLASFPFARRYLGNRCFFLFLQVLRCFSSLSYLLLSYVFT